MHRVWKSAVLVASLLITMLPTATVQQIAAQTSAPMTTVTVSTIAGGQWGSTDGIGSSVGFNYVTDIALSPNEQFALIADGQDNTIRRLDLASGAVTTYAGRPRTSGSQDGAATEARFNQPYDIEISADGSFALVTDQGNLTIRRLDLLTNSVSTIAGRPGSTGTQDGVGNAAQFNVPHGLAIAPNGSYALVTDYHNHTVRKLDLATRVISTYLGTANRFGSVDGVGDAAGFEYPAGVAISSDGSFALVTEEGSTLIRRVDLVTAAVTTLAGGPPDDRYEVDGVGTAARFWGPSHVTISDDQRYALISSFQTLRRLDLETRLVTTLAGKHWEIQTIDGPGAIARFQSIRGLDLSRDGSFALIADLSGNTIRKAVSTGQSTTPSLLADDLIVFPPNVPASDLLDGEIPADYPLADISLPDADGRVTIGSFSDQEVLELYAAVSPANPDELPTMRFPMVIRGTPALRIGDTIAVNFSGGATARVTRVTKRDNFTLIQAELLIPQVGLPSALRALETQVQLDSNRANQAESNSTALPVQRPVSGTGSSNVFLPYVVDGTSRSATGTRDVTNKFPAFGLDCEASPGLKASSIKFEGGGISVEPVIQFFEPTTLRGQPAQRVRFGARSSLSFDASINLAAGVFGELKCNLGPAFPLPGIPLTPVASAKPMVQLVVGLDVSGEGILSGTFRQQCDFKTSLVQGADVSQTDIEFYSENPLNSTKFDCKDKSSGLIWNETGALPGKINVKFDIGTETKIGIQIGGKVAEGSRELGKRFPWLRDQIKKVVDTLLIDAFKAKTVARLDNVYQNTEHLLGRVYADGSRKNESKFIASALLEGKLENSAIAKLAKTFGLGKAFELTPLNYLIPIVQLHRPLKGTEITIDGAVVTGPISLDADRGRALVVNTTHQDMAVLPSPFSGIPPASLYGNAPPRKGELWHEIPGNATPYINTGITVQPDQMRLNQTLLLSPAQCAALPSGGGIYHLIGYNQTVSDLNAPGYLGKVVVTCSTDDYAFIANYIQVGTDSQGMNIPIVGKRCDPAVAHALGVELVAGITPKPTTEWRVESAQLQVDGQVVATSIGQTVPRYSIETVRDLDLPKGIRTLTLVAQIKSLDGTRSREARYSTSFQAIPKPCPPPPLPPGGDPDGPGGPGGGPSSPNPNNPTNPPMGTWGDPHIKSADGISFDSHELGEFVYLQPQPGKDGLTIQGRQQRAAPGAHAAVTSAIAIRIGEHIFEYSTRREPLLDRKPIVGNYVDLGAGATLSLTTGAARLTAPDVHLELYRGSRFIDLRVVVPDSDQLEGMLGTPNGNKNDDMRLPNGEITTNPQALADAWRITERAKSLFTYQAGEGPETFNMPNNGPIPSEAILAPFVTQATNLLANTCAAGDPTETAQKASEMALDLYYGVPPADLAPQLCGYAVRGRATSQSFNNVPIAGLAVTISSNQLNPCTATTDRDGYYYCRLAPKTGAGVPQVTIAAPGAANTTTTFASLAPANETATLEQDLSISSPIVRVALRTTQDGQPSGGVSVEVKGGLVTRQVVTRADGTAAVNLVFNPGTTSAQISARTVEPSYSNGAYSTVTLSANGVTNVALDIAHVTLNTPLWRAQSDLAQASIVGLLSSQPAIAADGTVYTIGYDSTSWSRHVYAFARNGSLRWRSPALNGVNYRAAPVIGSTGDILVVGRATASGSDQPVALLAFNAATGAQKWSFVADLGYNKSEGRVAVAADGTLYLVATRSSYDQQESSVRMYAIDGQTGTKIWDRLLRTNASGGHYDLAGGVPTIAADGSLYVGVSDRLLALNPDGSEKWHYIYPADDRRQLSTDTLSVAPNGTLLVQRGRLSGDNMTYDLLALAPTGTLLWQKKYVNQYGGAIIAGTDGNVYVPDVDRLVALDLATGEQRWTFAAELPWKAVTLAADGTVFVAHREPIGGVISALSPQGNEKYRLRLSRHSDEPLVLGLDGTLYAIAGHDLYAFDSRTTGAAASAWSSAFGSSSNDSRAR